MWKVFHEITISDRIFVIQNLAHRLFIRDTFNIVFVAELFILHSINGDCWSVSNVQAIVLEELTVVNQNLYQTIFLYKIIFFWIISIEFLTTFDINRISLKISHISAKRIPRYENEWWILIDTNVLREIISLQVDV